MQWIKVGAWTINVESIAAVRADIGEPIRAYIWVFLRGVHERDKAYAIELFEAEAIEFMRQFEEATG